MESHSRGGRWAEKRIGLERLEGETSEELCEASVALVRTIVDVHHHSENDDVRDHHHRNRPGRPSCVGGGGITAAIAGSLLSLSSSYLRIVSRGGNHLFHNDSLTRSEKMSLNFARISRLFEFLKI